jgi:hypothetical protein
MYRGSKTLDKNRQHGLAPGERVDTLAASVLLVGFNWPEKSERYRRMANFVNAFFSKFSEFHQPPRHPKWSEASPNIKIPGWQRFKAADEWLAEHARATAPAADSGGFERFLSQNGGAISNLATEETAALFQQFLEWQKTQPSSANRMRQ